MAEGPTRARIAALLSPHHAFEDGWLTDASVVVTAHLDTGGYACIFSEDGSSMMPMSHTFTVEYVLEPGALARPTIDLAPPYESSVAWPSQLHDGRRYLLLLSPSEASRVLLADETQFFGVNTQLGQSEIVAIIDLDATGEESAQQRESVRTHAKREAYTLDGPHWQTLRATAGVSTDELMAALHALRERHVANWETREQALALLGPADRTKRTGQTVDTYFVNARDAELAADGIFVAQIELTTSGSGELLAYEEEFLLGDAGKLRVASYEEKKGAGLDWVHIEMAGLSGP